jgi:isopropylmalate/homocitrate/citramalate synthase
VSSGAWHTDKWFTSPYNWADEVRAQLGFAKKVQFHDVSLRDGEQQAGIMFTKDEKVAIAEKLAEAGVHRIEAGMPAVSKQDEAAIREIVKRRLGPKIFAFSRCMVEDIDRAADCGVDGVVVEIPSSQHMVKHAYRWPMEKAIELSVKATRHAHELGLYTVFFPIDASRAELDWVLNLFERVATEGHMDALAVVDTLGGCSPHAIPYLIKTIKSRINKPLETHFHDDFGLGVANTILGLAAGAEVAHTTVTGIGERAGNAAYEDVALALLTMYGIDTGLNYAKMVELSHLVTRLAGVAVPPNRSIVGERLLNVESGIITTWFLNCGEEHQLELFPFRWDLVGQNRPRVVLGKNSGADSIKHYLAMLGLQATQEQVGALLVMVKDWAMKNKRIMTQDEFAALAREFLAKV